MAEPVGDGATSHDRQSQSVVALSSIKGGVGKTSAAVNLAALAGAAGFRTLLWDLDPQGAATYTMRVGSRAPGGARRLPRQRPGVRSAIAPTAWPLVDVIPADFSLRHLDLELAALGKPRRRIVQVLEPVRSQYDVVFIDCPPGINLTVESILRATSVVLVPIVPSVLPLRSYDQLAAYVDAEKKLRKTEVLGFLSMVDRRKKRHRELLAQLPADRRGILPIGVPASVKVETMPVHRTPLVVDDHVSAPAIAYRQLWDEVQKRLPPPANRDGR